MMKIRMLSGSQHMNKSTVYDGFHELQLFLITQVMTESMEWVYKEASYLVYMEASQESYQDIL